MGGGGGGGGALLGPLYRSNVWKFLSVQVPFYNPGVDLIYLHTGISGVFFFGFEFRKSVLFWVLVRTIVVFGDFYVFDSIFRSSFIHQVLQ